MQKKKNDLWNQKCKHLVENAHSFDELVTYITTKYQAKKMSEQSESYIEEYRSIKSALVLKERPDLVCIPVPEKPEIVQMSNPEFMSEYFHQIELRSKQAADVEDSIFPLDLEQYLITIDNEAGHDHLFVNLEYEFRLLRITFQHNFKKKTDVKNPCSIIARDIYHYYGITKEDIELQNERCRTYIHMVGL